MRRWLRFREGGQLDLDIAPVKQCRACREWKSVSAFSSNGMWTRTVCKPCRAELAKITERQQRAGNGNDMMATWLNRPWRKQ